MLKWTKITKHAGSPTLQTYGPSKQDNDDELTLITFFRSNCSIDELENHIKLSYPLSLVGGRHHPQN